MCRNRIRLRSAPIDSAAVTNSLARMARTCPRISLAYSGQSTMATARRALLSPAPPRAAVIAMARMIEGKERMASAVRMITLSSDTSGVAGNGAEQATNGAGQRDDEDAGRHGDSRAPNDAADHVAAKIIGAQRMIDAWPLQLLREILEIGILDREAPEPGCQERATPAEC